MNNIIENLNKDGAFYKFNGIVECVKFRTTDADVIDALKRLKTDSSRIAGREIAQYSVAALDILGVEKYEGDNEDVLSLIKSQLVFKRP